MRPLAIGETSMQHLITLGTKLHRIWLGRTAAGYALHYDGARIPVTLAGENLLRIDGETVPFFAAAEGDHLFIHLGGRAYALSLHDPVKYYAVEVGADAADFVRAPMPGSVIATPVMAGDKVAAGDTLVVIESMKIEVAIKAPRAGVVEAVAFSLGQSFERDAVLVTLTEEQR
jgi:3-methylcrotonyl-CoA carboxylase alpha subunit